MDRRDTRFLRLESCANKRLLGAFETDPVCYRLQLRHLTNVFGILSDSDSQCPAVSTTIYSGVRWDGTEIFRSTSES
jgi:hypothetical protein